MRTYQTYHRGRAPIGSIAVKLYRSGDEVRAFLREVEGADEDDTIFPSEELEPDVALRLAENKRQNDPTKLVYIEMAEGVEWNPEWETNTTSRHSTDEQDRAAGR